MKRLRRIALPLLLLLVLALTPALGIACRETKASVTDDLDKSFSFDAPVTTIVTLAPSNTEVVFAVGAGDKLIGRTDYCNFPPQAASVESVGGFWNPDKEKVVVLDPDVVLANGAHDDSGDTAWLEDKGLTVITLEPQTLADIMDNILMVGRLTGQETEASQLVEDLESRIDYVSDRTAGLTDGQKPRVLHVTWHDPLWTVGADSFINEVIDISGGVNIFADLSGDVQANMDTAVIRNPEVITVVTGHGSAMNAPYEAITAGDSVFKTTDAYVNDRIRQVNTYLTSRGGPRIIEALEMYARWIHPEIFG